MGFDSVVIFLLLGGVVGFFAGLLGVGGGGIMVPVLTSYFLYKNVPVDSVVHLALGTSMASIIMTSASSLYAHQRHQGVVWNIVKVMAPAVLIGTFVATYLVTHISSQQLAIFFAVFMTYVSIQMFLNIQPKPSRSIPGKVGLLSAGGGIGAISAVVAIGGGSLTVPFLAWHNVPIKKAIGTSAAIGFPIAIAGTLGYLINGLSNTYQQDYLYGFIYLPAVMLISLVSYFTAPLGARLAHRLPVPVLKKVFALFLLLLGAKMLFSII
ncbi:MAG: sulfite exporter TauE/SafE family protein [Gammaproteobacteria bacterium]